MGMTLPDLAPAVAAEPYYATLFTSAFGTPQVTSDRISRALAQFVRSIISTQSKFDAGIPSNFANFTAAGKPGPPNLQRPGRPRHLRRLPRHRQLRPRRRHQSTTASKIPTSTKASAPSPAVAQDEGLFKVPSLRNIALTAPYMHDGRFATLEEVVEFYNSGVVNHPNLSPPLRIPPAPRRARPAPPPQSDDAQKAALVAFLKTLTDTSLATDPKFSDPFNYGK